MNIMHCSDWDGVNHYEQVRATMVANDMGYIGFAADIYGKDLHNVDSFDDKIYYATMYRSNTTLFISRIQSAINEVMNLTNVDVDNIGIIGYCFGGTGALMVRL